MASFLTADERAALRALVERIFPGDADGPGACELGVVEYLDRQLAGPWGEGAGTYREAPYEPADHPGHGWQSPLTPAQAYRRALSALEAEALRNHGRVPAGLTDAELDGLLAALAAGRLPGLDDPSPATFFAMLCQKVIEGLFSDPSYGGNRNLGGWRWLGYPGVAAAHGGDYAERIGRHGEPYAPEPRSLP